MLSYIWAQERTTIEVDHIIFARVNQPFDQDIISAQVLDQVTLKPGDVCRDCAIQFGEKNRNMDYLPGRPELRQ